jgi:hypothetical protein
MKVAWVLVAALVVGCGKHHSSGGASRLDAGGSGMGGAGGGTGGATGGAAGLADAAGGEGEIPDAFAPIDALLVDAAPLDAPAPDGGVAATLDAAVGDAPGPDLADAAVDFPPAPDGPPPLTPEFHVTLPLSSSIVTTRSPTIGWTDPGGTDYFIVDVCRDIACTDILEREFSGLTTQTLMMPLPEGVAYWRVKAMLPNNGGQLSTATAEVFIGPQTPHDTAMLALPDFNRDGIADVALAAEGGDVTVRWLRSDAGGPVLLGAPQALAGPARALAYGIDLNADGFGDLLVARADSVDVYYGSATSLIRVGNLSGGVGFGATLAGVGDVNGDGLGDVVVGTQPASGAGTASLFLSSRMGLGKPTGLVLPSARFGAAADVNADGYADVVVCSPITAKLSLYPGSGGGLGSVTVYDDPRGGGSAGSFGNACQGVGDINGDGFGDVVVTGSGGAQLLAFIYLGGEKGFGQPHTLMLGSAAGHSADELLVASAGDVNRDGYGDVVITGAGAVQLFLGGASGLAEMPAASLAGDYRLAAGLGDLNGDKNGDVLVAPRACGEPVKIFGGTATGLTSTPIYTFPAGGACPGPLLAR